MEQQRIILSHDNLQQSLTDAIAECSYDRLFVLTDETTARYCLPVIVNYPCMEGAIHIAIGSTEHHKTLKSLSHVWSKLQEGGATRHSLIINLGGGMVTDLGGFAASTFKRGIQYINIPTTLLSMVDASVGGKTGINFGGLKNEIGVFNNAHSVILDTIFLCTLDHENLLSGYAEMLKHALISNKQMWANHITFSPITSSPLSLSSMVADSVAVKQRIVAKDPTEQGIRKALNLGHTAGHAFESLALERSLQLSNSLFSPILHGYAVAYGLIVELYLSAMKVAFPTDYLHQTVASIKEHFGRMTITCDDYPRLLELMHHDKKNEGNTINFTLLGDIGDIRINQTATENEIKEALDFYCEC